MWEEVEEEEAEVAVEEPVTLFEDPDDTLIFSGNATGAQILTDTSIEDTISL